VKKLLKGCLILCGGAFGLLLIAALLFSAGTEQTADVFEEVEEELVATAAPVELPTDTSVPAAVPVEAPTEKPTEEPVPTDIPSPELDYDAAYDYLTEMQDIGIDLSLAMSGLARMSQEPSEDPTVLLRDSWVKEYRGYAQDIIDGYHAAENIEPPAVFEETHDLTVGAFQKCAYAGEFVLKAMDALEEGDMDGAVQYMTDSTTYMVQCGEEIVPATESLDATIDSLID
jgi:hypothetical protein